jgi:formylglycine-generating enzyme required for sulfatase activity
MAIWELGAGKPAVKLQNRFLLEKLLGAGGFGETYRAQDEKMGRSVVLKVLNADKHQDREARRRFKEEATVLAGLQHPHVVTVYDLLELDERDAIVMEWLDGCNLTAHLHSEQRWCLPEAEALMYIEQAAAALEYVHGQGLLHRDIKPDNLMRCADGRIKLIDFGLAKQFDPNVTYQNTGYLTNGYAPIEQYEQRGKFTNALDIYALAATWYYLLTDQHPIPANLRGMYDLKAPQEINGQISAVTNQAIMWGMEREPMARPQNIEDFRARFKAVSATPTNLVIPIQPRPVVVTPQPVVTPQVVQQEPKLELFSFNIARLQIKEGFFGGKKVVVNKSPGQAKRFIEDLGNGIKLEMVAIPGGEFMMGAPATEESSRDNERPQHRVKVPSFYMGRYTVTQAQYEALMGENPSVSKGKDLPVENVSWTEAQDFCRRLTKRSKGQYSLPSEAQWEYACRAGTTTPFYFGGTIGTDVANYNGNYTYGDGIKGKYLCKTTPVGSFDVANDFGLSDMHGNLWEWCEDTWHNDYSNAPTDGTAWAERNLSDHVLRGGSWLNYPINCRSANRIRDVTVYQLFNFGFRVVYAPARTS